jgi:small subunit ribosomal protein S9
MPSTIFTGRRKTSVARVRLSRGAGTLTLNGRPFEEYFPTEKQRAHVLEPFVVLEQVGQWDIDACLNGGGTIG